MIENRRKVLDMLAENKITTDEAERLLTAVDEPVADGPGPLAPAGGKPRFLHVRVEPGPNGSSKGDDGQEHVNVRVDQGRDEVDGAYPDGCRSRDERGAEGKRD